MARPLIEGRHYTTFEQTRPSAGPLAGAAVRVLSTDDEDGAFSAMVEVPAGTSVLPEEGRSLEVLLLAGSGSLGGEQLKPTFYGFIPRTESHMLTFDTDSVLFYATGELGTGDGETLVVDPDTVPWRIRIRENIVPASTAVLVDLVDGAKPPVTVNANPGGPVSVNIVKFLRAGESDGSSASLGAMFPGSGLDCAEWHRSVDEGISLRGDELVYADGGTVEVGPGCYTWRPANARHLPKYSHTGHMGFARTREAGWNVTVEYEAEPSWPALLAAYQSKLGAAQL